MLDNNNNSKYTIAVDALVDAISGIKNPHSLFRQAEVYFKQAPKNKEKITILTDKIDQLILETEDLPKDKVKARLLDVRALQKELKTERLAQRVERIKRLAPAIKICQDLLELSEGEDYEQTQLKSAKFLATIMLFSPGKGKQLAELHQSLKPAYKAVLSVRLLDKLVSDGLVKNTYILAHYDAEKRYIKEDINTVCYTQSVILPIMLAAMFQDVGLQHPDLMLLLEGEAQELDRFRLLEPNERTKMLTLNYKRTIDYLKFGLGGQLSPSEYSEEQKKEFTDAENKRLKFQLALIEDANFTKLGISEIIKVPQIYASVIFSTKRDFDKRTTTNASILIAQLAIKKVFSSQVANAFVSIVGQFPLGYGVVYIPKDTRGNELEVYEYAIVTGLNPEKSEHPICRPVSKNLMFLEFSVKGEIEKERNLHFQKSRKKLEKIDPKRLIEILQKLTHNFKPEDVSDLLPYYWEPHEYFCINGNQNLWNQSN